MENNNNHGGKREGAGRKKIKNSLTKTQRVMIRLTVAEEGIIKKEADKKNDTVSGLIRDIIEKYIKNIG